jgi:single-strand DNA-binding protein
MINKVVLIGHMGKDPEKRSLPSGAVYVRFSVATNESYKDKEGNWQDATEWHNIVMWREMAERASTQLKKGNLVFIEGKLTHRSWQDQDGNMKNMTEIVAQTYRKLDKNKSNGGGGYEMPEPVEVGGQGGSKISGDQNDNVMDNQDDAEDDLPF